MTHRVNAWIAQRHSFTCKLYRLSRPNVPLGLYENDMSCFATSLLAIQCSGSACNVSC